MEKKEIVIAMKSEIKGLKNQFEKMKVELKEKRREMRRKQRALILFTEEISVKKIDSEPLQAVQNPILVAN